MRLYLASVGPKSLAHWVVKNYPEIGALCTFATPGSFKKMVEYGFNHIFLDSGAFSVDKSGAKIDIDTYIDFIKSEVLPSGKDVVIASLDVIADKTGQQSLANWEYMRSKGINALPAYHVGEPIEILDYYVANAEYVALGGMAGDIVNWKRLVPAMDKIFQRHPDAKFHIFGINDFRIVQRFPFFSCDAVTWKCGTMYGSVITPYGTWDVGRKDGNGLEVSSSALDKWLLTHNISYPFPDDFDFNELNKINIKVIYESLVLQDKITSSSHVYLF